MEIDIRRYTRVCEATAFLNGYRLFQNVYQGFTLGSEWRWTHIQTIAFTAFEGVQIKCLGRTVMFFKLSKTNIVISKLRF